MSDAQWLGICAVMCGLCPWLMRGFAESRELQFYFTDRIIAEGATPLTAAVIVYLVSLVCVIGGIFIFVRASRATKE